MKNFTKGNVPGKFAARLDFALMSILLVTFAGWAYVHWFPWRYRLVEITNASNNAIYVELGNHATIEKVEARTTKNLAERVVRGLRFRCTIHSSGNPTSKILKTFDLAGSELAAHDSGNVIVLVY